MPATVVFSATSSRTRLPAATIEFLPIVTLPKIVLEAKIETPSSILGCLSPLVRHLPPRGTP